MNSCGRKDWIQSGSRKSQNSVSGPVCVQGKKEQGSGSCSKGGAKGCFTHTRKNGHAHIQWDIWHWGQSCLSAIWRMTLLQVSKGWSASAAKAGSLKHLPVFISCQTKQMDLVSKPADKTLKVLLCFFLTLGPTSKLGFALKFWLSLINKRSLIFQLAVFVNKNPTQLTVTIFSIGRLNLHFVLIKGGEMAYQKLQQNNSINKITNMNDNHAVTNIHYLLS